MQGCIYIFLLPISVDSSMTSSAMIEKQDFSFAFSEFFCYRYQVAQLVFFCILYSYEVNIGVIFIV